MFIKTILTIYIC